MSGILYICSTPIGNLKDITLRTLEILKEVDLIACEDTRHTIKLLNHYDIKTHLESYYEHNKHFKGQKIINLLKKGKNIALVSDAGTPCISDPGEDLIKLCYANDIKVTVLPGATAAISALVISGLKTRSYVFEGFLPSNKKIRKTILENLKNEYRTSIIYEAPHNLKNTLKELFLYTGDRQIAIIKEISKKYENVFKTSLNNAIQYFEKNDPKGEYVIVLEGLSLEELEKGKIDNLSNNISIEEQFSLYTANGQAEKDAMKAIAKERGISKREVYSILKK